VPRAVLQNRIALPCAQGTYKPSLGQAVKCLKCPAGSTTHSIRHTTAAACKTALPGYQILRGEEETFYVEACPHSTYSPGYSTQPCRPCPMGLTTPSTGSTSVSDCSVPPGHGFYCSTGHPAGSGPVTSSMLQQLGSPRVVPCPQGSYKAGWGRQPCVSCGVNFRSLDQATSAQQCYIPAGWGSTQSWKEGGLVATKCMHGLYGSQPVYGTTRKRPCQVGWVAVVHVLHELCLYLSGSVGRQSQEVVLLQQDNAAASGLSNAFRAGSFSHASSYHWVR